MGATTFSRTEWSHPLCPSRGAVKLLHARSYRPLPPWQAIGARTYFSGVSDPPSPIKNRDPAGSCSSNPPAAQPHARRPALIGNRLPHEDGVEVGEAQRHDED